MILSSDRPGRCANCMATGATDASAFPKRRLPHRRTGRPHEPVEAADREVGLESYALLPAAKAYGVERMLW